MNYQSAGQENDNKSRAKGCGGCSFPVFPSFSVFFLTFCTGFLPFAGLVVRHYAATALFIETASGLPARLCAFFNGFQGEQKARTWRIEVKNSHSRS